MTTNIFITQYDVFLLYMKVYIMLYTFMYNKNICCHYTSSRITEIHLHA